MQVYKNDYYFMFKIFLWQFEVSLLNMHYHLFSTKESESLFYFYWSKGRKVMLGICDTNQDQIRRFLGF